VNPRIIKMENTQVILGLEWFLLDARDGKDKPLPERRAVQKVLKENAGVKAGVVVRSADTAVLGLMPKGHKKPSVPSGAALLAFASQDAQGRSTGQSSSIEDTQWMVVERLGDDEFWLVDLRDGVVVPGADFVGSLDKVRQYMDEMLQDPGFKVFSTDPEIQHIAEHRATIIHKDAATLISDIEKPARGNLKTLSGLDPTMLAVIVAFALAVGGFFGYDYFSKMQKERQLREQAAARQSEEAQRLKKETDDYVANVKTAILTALDAGVEGVNTALQTPSSREVLGAWVSLIENVPVNHSGWTTERVECLMETPEKPLCTVYIRRGPSGINRILLEDYPDVQLNGDEGSYVVRGPDLTPRGADWNQLDSAHGFMMGLVSDLQFIQVAGLSYNQSASSDIVQAVTLPTPPASLFTPGTEQAAAPAPVNTGISKGDLGLTGEGLWQLPGLGKLLDRNGVGVKGMNLDLKSSKEAWQLQSEYFIRSLPSPVLPVIVGPKDVGAITVELPEKYKALVSKDPMVGNARSVGASEASAPQPEAPAQPAAAPAANAPLSLGLPEEASADPTP